MKKIFISLFVVLFVFSCSKVEEKTVVETPLKKEEAKLETKEVMEEKVMKDLGQSYSTDWENIYFNGEELILAYSNTWTKVDYKNIIPVSDTYFKDPQNVYFRSFQDSFTFWIVAEAHSETFVVKDLSKWYQWEDKNTKYSFWIKVDSFPEWELCTASNPEGCQKEIESLSWENNITSEIKIEDNKIQWTKIGKNLKIENDNIVIYENGKKTKILTKDGKKKDYNNCEGNYSIYSIEGVAHWFTLVENNAGICQADGGVFFYVFDNKNGSILESLPEMINKKYGIYLGYAVMGDSVSVINEKIVINGKFVYNGGCEDMWCSREIPKNVIEKLGISIKKEPQSNDNPGEFEFSFNGWELFNN